MGNIYFVPILFFVIAFVFSMLGRGGATLYVPLLFWLGMDLKTQAIPLGMLLNVVNTSVPALTFGLKKMINWRLAIPSGLAMIAFAPLGAWLNVNLPTKPIILILALFTAISVIPLIGGWHLRYEPFSQRNIKVGVFGGSILGFFAGLIGRGGGSFVVPLLYVIGLDIKIAAATSAFVVTLSGISSFLSHMILQAQPQWLIWIPCVIAVLAGSQLGSRLMITKLKPNHLKWIFVTISLGVAIALVVKDVILG
jgi:hypothetical protein